MMAPTVRSEHTGGTLNKGEDTGIKVDHTSGNSHAKQRGQRWVLKLNGIRTVA